MEAFLGRSYGRPMLNASPGGVPQGETAEAYLERTYGGDKRHMTALGYRDRDWFHPKAFLQSERPRIKGLVARSRSLGMR